MSSKAAQHVIQAVSPGSGEYLVGNEDWSVTPRYALESWINGGSYGTVCRAVDQKTGKTVAIKKIYSVFTSRTVATRCLREVSILRQIIHPSVVILHNVLPPPPAPIPFNDLYLIFEYAQTDLRKIMGSARKMKESEVKWIIFQMLVGMDFLHQSHIIHRDLKPANILILDEKTLELRIADFGLAREIREVRAPSPPRPTGGDDDTDNEDDDDDDDDDAPPTIAAKKPAAFKAAAPAPVQKAYSTHVVTRWYRAPEIILSEGTYTTEIDVWSVGCMFGELLLMTSDPHMYSPMFPGRSCYPMSPDGRNKQANNSTTRSDYDQLNVIFDVIGTPTPEDIASIPDEKTRAMLRGLEPRAPAVHELYDNIDPQALDLLVKMLAFDPSKRLTIHQALAHPYWGQDSARFTAQINEMRSKYGMLADDGGHVTPARISFEERIERWPTKANLRQIAQEEIAYFVARNQ